MKLTIERQAGAQNEIILRCESLDEEMREILSLIQARKARIAARPEGEENIVLLEPQSALYADAVEGKTFLYTRDRIYRVDYALGELEALFESHGFLRVSKSQVVNLNGVVRLKSLASSRIELTLQSGEKLIASRHYAMALREKLLHSERKEKS